MKLNELLDGVALAARHVQDVECSGICCDTREMTPGCLFVALPGYKTDGHRYIRQALERGAAAVLCQRPPEGEGPWLVTEDTRAALAIASANWFGHPARELTLLAVTGTNGKTTTTYLLKAMLEGCLHTKVGLIGTNQNLIGEESLPAHRTTPESFEVQRLFRKMADAGQAAGTPLKGHRASAKKKSHFPSSLKTELLTLPRRILLFSPSIPSATASTSAVKCRPGFRA
mgnify:CR=1 FL=1